jgi:hypothetical protein
MGLLFLSDKREDLLAMVEEVAEGVEDLGFGDAQRFGDIQYRFTLSVQCDHVADGHPQTVNHRLAAADAFEPDDMRIRGLDGFGHTVASEGKSPHPSPV